MALGNANLWRLYAWVYDSVMAMFLPYRKLTHLVVDELKLPPGARILDAGCGTGNLVAHLAKTRPDVEATGVDFSKAMLHRARKKTKYLQKVSLLEADLNEQLPFNDGEFDRITSVNVLYAVPRPAFLLQEMHRVLRPEGEIIVVTPIFATKMSPIFGEHVAGLRMHSRLWPLVLTYQIVKAAPAAVLFLLINKVIQEDKSFHFFKEETLRTLAEGRGFHIKAIERVYGKQCWFLVGRKQK